MQHTIQVTPTGHGRYLATYNGGRDLCESDNPILDAARALLDAGAKATDTLKALISGNYPPTMIPVTLAKLVAPRLPHPPIRWKHGKQAWNVEPDQEDA